MSQKDKPRFHGSPHPIRTKWDMRHESKVSYKRSTAKQEMEEELEDNEEDDDLQRNTDESENIAEGSDSSILSESI